MTQDNAASREARARYVAELREIAGMVAQTADGPLRWKQYRLTAIADFLALADEAASQPREGVERAYREGLWAGWSSGRAGETMTNPYATRAWLSSDASAALDTAPTDQAQGCGEVERLRAALAPLAALGDTVNAAMIRSLGVGLSGLLGGTTLPVGGPAIRDECTITLDALSAARFAFAHSGDPS